MGVVLDTDICIGILNADIPKQAFLSRFGHEKLYLTSSTIFELYRGLYKRLYQKNAISKQRFEIEHLRLNQFIQNFTELAYTGKEAEITAKIYERLRDQGEEIGLFDCQIAGTILAHGLAQLVTWNTKHFQKIPELELLSI